MFDIGWTEIAIIGIVALIIIGPKDLPRVLRTLGQWTAKARSLTREFRGHVDDMIRESELDEVRKEFGSLAETNVNTLIENTIDPDEEIRDALDFDGEGYADELDDLSDEETVEPGEIADEGMSAPDDTHDDDDGSSPPEAVETEEAEDVAR